MPLNPNHDRMRAAGYDREALELVERAMGATLAPDRQAAIRAEEEAAQRQRMRAELDDLKGFADRVEAGAYGPEGKAIAAQILAGGRVERNLRELREAIRRLR